MRPQVFLSTATLIGIAVTASSCNSTPQQADSYSGMQEAVTEITNRLIEAAELRVDMRSVRVCVHEIGADPMEARAMAASSLTVPGDDWVGRELQKEIVVAIANRLNVVDTELGRMDAPDLRKTKLHDAADHFGASHFLVGDYVSRGDEVILSVRLVDSESNLIVAAARGVVRVPGFDDRRRGRSVGLSTAAAGAPSLASAARSQASSTPPQGGSSSSPQPEPEDFETWLARQEAERAAEQDLKQAAEGADLSQASTPASEPPAARAESSKPPRTLTPTSLDPTGRMPWRTRRLAELLGIGDGPAVATAKGAAQASDGDPR